jgi:hypothetical protein
MGQEYGVAGTDTARCMLLFIARGPQATKKRTGAPNIDVRISHE